MIGLLYETERCLDGLRLDAEGYFRPLSERREPVRIITADLANPVAIQLANADDLVRFMSWYSAGDIITPGTFPRDYTPHIHITRIEAMKLAFRQFLIDASGPNPVDTFVALSRPFVSLKASLRLYEGKPQLLAQCDDLLNFLRAETMLIALEGAKVVVCEQCQDLFLAGPGTGRRVHAIHCSDKCRVASSRARKKEED